MTDLMPPLTVFAADRYQTHGPYRDKGWSARKPLIKLAAAMTQTPAWFDERSDRFSSSCALRVPHRATPLVSRWRRSRTTSLWLPTTWWPSDARITLTHYRQPSGFVVLQKWVRIAW